MSRTNLKAVSTAPRTHEGAPGGHIKPIDQLERQVATCMLFENTFYEGGSTIAKEITSTCEKVGVEDIAAMAVKARGVFKLRHVPLFLLAQLDKRRVEAKGLLKRTVEEVVQRPDEMGELLSIIQKESGGKPLKKCLSAQVKKGLARAFKKFNPYQLAKWNRDSAIKLRDVLFLTHAKPGGKEQEATWKALIEGTLPAPDTWEVALSAGADKKATWERLMEEDKLGGIATLMNLRNMIEAKVPRGTIEGYLGRANFSRVLPFRFISAAKHAPDLEDALGKAMVKALDEDTRLPGRTLLVVDISGSMRGALSAKSEVSRIDAACGVAMLLREVCDEVTIYATAGNDASQKAATGKVPPRHAFALRDAINGLQGELGGGGIFIFQTMEHIFAKEGDGFDRVIVLNDEQDCDHTNARSPAHARLLGKRNFLVNVAPYKPGVELGRWTRINGFSERIVDFIRWEEANQSKGE